MGSILLSAMIMARNEERHLPDCLGLLGFCDEIVIVLDRCTDDSEKIARSFTDRVITGAWEIEDERRNVGIEACRGEWIIQLDADERISAELAAEIVSEIKKYDEGYFCVGIDNYIGGRLMRHFGAADFIKNVGFIPYHRTSRVMQEGVVRRFHSASTYTGTRRYLQNRLVHYMDDDLSDTLSRFNRYTSLRALELRDNPGWRRSYIRCAVGLFSRFFRVFIRRRGYKEGYLGLLLSILFSIYPLVSHLKADLEDSRDRLAFLHPFKSNFRFY